MGNDFRTRYLKRRKHIQQQKYGDRSDNASAVREHADLQVMRKALGMKELERVTRYCLRCEVGFITFRMAGVFMCSKCRTCNDSKDENFTY